MNHSTSSLRVARRTVLGGTAALGAVAAVEVGAGAAVRRRPVVGVLTSSLPGRPALSRQGEAFVTGLKVGLGGAQKKVHHAEVMGGYSGLTETAAGLIGRGVNVLVACVSEAKADDLAALCAEHRVALVMAGTGAQVAAPEQRQGRPSALHTSTQHWQSSLSMGGWAAQHLGTTLHHVVAAPDAGFDSVYALRRGFTGAGGTVVGLSVTHEANGLGHLVAEVKAAGAQVIGISASGARAAQIAQALRAGGVRGRLVLDPTTSSQISLFGSAADGAHLGGSHVVPARRSALAQQLRKRGGGTVTTAGILGHDTGLLIVAGLGRLGTRSWDRLPARLVGTRVSGVRGEQRVDAQGRVSVPLAVRKVRRHAGKRSVVAVAKRARIAGAAPAMAVVQGRLSSGYVNEYATT